MLWEITLWTYCEMANQYGLHCECVLVSCMPCVVSWWMKSYFYLTNRLTMIRNEKLRQRQQLNVLWHSHKIRNRQQTTQSDHFYFGRVEMYLFFFVAAALFLGCFMRHVLIVNSSLFYEWHVSLLMLPWMVLVLPIYLNGFPSWCSHSNGLVLVALSFSSFFPILFKRILTTI